MTVFQLDALYAICIEFGSHVVKYRYLDIQIYADTYLYLSAYIYT